MIIRLDEQREKMMLILPDLAQNDYKAVLDALSSMPGITDVSWDAYGKNLEIYFNPILLDSKSIDSYLDELGFLKKATGDDGATHQSILRLEGLDCADCAAKLEKRISMLPGVESVNVNYGAAKMQVIHQNPLPEIISAARNMGYHAWSESDPTDEYHSSPFWLNNKYALSTFFSAGFLALAILLQVCEAPLIYVKNAYVLGILTGAYLPARAGIAVLLGARELDMNVLMTLAAFGAMAIGQWQEGAVVVLLFSLGNALQAYTMDKTRKSIRSLMDLSPDHALVRRNGQESLIASRDIMVGDTVIVHPGERIPMDGIIVKGTTSIDQSPITGESAPVDKDTGDRVFAGTLNTYGSIEFLVEKSSSDSTIQKIIHLVEEAQGEKAPSQQLVDRFSRYYTPIVIASAVLVAVIPSLFFHQAFEHWFYQALGMLLVACPCALVISTPVSIVSAIGSAARQGVLIKGGAPLELSGQLSVIVFDKTGTLTLGRPRVTHIHSILPGQEEMVLKIAASVELRSEHPLAKSIVEHSRSQGLDFYPVENFQAISGMGARALIENSEYLIGNPRLLLEQGYEINLVKDRCDLLEEHGNTIILLADSEKILGILAVSDQLRPHAREAVQSLKCLGIEKTVMLTGDNPRVAAVIARHAGVDEFQAGLLPEEKVSAIRALMARFGKAGMVGDGINDAPALAASSLGIAMGVAGTDAALETADITLMADDLSKLSFTVQLGRRTLRTIKQNIAFSLIFKAAILLLVIPGWLTLWLAVFGDMGTSLIVTLNGLRLLKNN